MDEPKDDIRESQGRTDGSLAVERESGRGAESLSDSIATRAQDDRIERGRLRADERLFRFRARADELLARERLAAPTRCIEAAQERRRSDEQMRTERRVTDEMVDEARGQADLRTADRRAREVAAEARQRDLIHDTDSHLEAERDHVEVERTQRERRLAMVSHDLRNPLAVISLSARYLLEGCEDPTRMEAIEDIDRAAARMERLLLDLLDVARIDAGTLRMHKTEQDVGVFLGEIRDSYRSLFADQGLTLEVNVPSDPVVVAFDHDRIVQVFSNVLGNALKFTRDGSVSLTVHVDVDAVEFEVRDSGVGVATDAMSHLFERFWQVDEKSRRGLGLGLYICREIIEQHEGRIWIDSTAGVGTSAHFTLPMEGSVSAPVAG